MSKRRNGRRAKHNGRSKYAGRRPGIEIFLADLSNPGADDTLLEWCLRHGVAPKQEWRAGTSKTRFLLLVKMGCRSIADGNDVLPELIAGALPIFTSITDHALERKVQTLLSADDQASFEQWMDSGCRPLARGPAASLQPTIGQVSIEPRAEIVFPLLEMRSLMLKIDDALLGACGIELPQRGLLSGSGTSVHHTEVVGDALLEQSIGGIFRVDDEHYTVLLGDYVLPVGQARGLVRVSVTLWSPDIDDDVEAGEHMVQIDGVTVGWLGLTHDAAEPLWQAITAALDRSGFAGEWDEPQVSGTLEPALFSWTAEQLKQNLGQRVQLDVAEESRVAREAEIKAERKRDERRWHDHEYELVAQRDAARASLERERENIKRMKADLASARDAVSANTPSLPDTGVDARVPELENRCSELQAKAEDYAEQIDALRQVIHAVEAERDAAVAALNAPGGTSEGMPMAPATLGELGGWAHRALRDRVIVVPRALRAARKSNFSDPGLVYRSLEALRDAYWSMKFGGDVGAQDAWQRFLCDEHLSCSHTGVGPDGRHAETYHVSWEGRRIPLDMHLRGNSGRHETRQFRVYFHADEATRRVIIGHLPSHLRNNET